jgi:hypothetical protein
MNNFKQFLEEGRDAPLYHGTYAEAADEIIKDNTMIAYTNHGRKVTSFSYYSKNFRGKVEQDGISLTRDIRFAWSWNGQVVFELDQRKLAQTHKIVPIKIEGVLRGKNRNAFMHMAEEFVIGPIKNFDKYLIRIHLKKEWTYPESLLKHPLIKWH